MRKISINFSFDPIWWRLMSMMSVLFFVYLADAIMSDWVPSFVQKSLGGSLMMGLVMAFSSVVGLAVDLVFPQLLKGTTVKKLILLSLLTSLGFVISMLFSSWWPFLVIILVGMAVWGVYYELLGFANQQFVSEEVLTQKRSMVWAVMGVFKSFAYFLGPILGGFLVASGDQMMLLVVMAITVVAAGTFSLAKFHNKKVEVEIEHINIWREIRHWWVLLKHVWPIVLISLMMGLIDATFWTTGTVWTDKLAKINPWGGMFLSLYMLPIFLMGFLMAYLKIYEHKKKIAEICLLIGGLVLVAMGLSDQVWWQLLVVFISSCAIAAASPLVDAVYTDVVSRMGQERKHLIGLSNSTISLAYIVGPVVAGALAASLGERLTFAATGAIVALVTGVLILITPRKLKLPQVEIKHWS
jgi:MFS family permease